MDFKESDEPLKCNNNTFCTLSYNDSNALVVGLDYGWIRALPVAYRDLAIDEVCKSVRTAVEHAYKLIDLETQSQGN